MVRAVLLVSLLLVMIACRPPSPDDDPTGPDAGTSDDGGPGADAAPAPDAALATTCLTTFTLEGNDGAAEVLVTGSFTGWAGSAADGALELTRASTAWTAEVELDPGTHLYKFVVDGAWIADPGNPNTADDGFGGVNSVVVCD
jgi:hypothetical protein